VIRRYVSLLALLLVANLVLPRVLPGDPFGYVGEGDSQLESRYPAETIERYTDYVGDGSLSWSELGRYLSKLAAGDLGYSLRYGAPVSEVIAARLPWTIGLALGATVLALLIGTSIGVASAVRRGRLADRVVFPVMVAVAQIPPFLVAIVLVVVFAVWLGWFPTAGGSSPFLGSAPLGERVIDIAHHAALPLAALVIPQAAGYGLVVRAATASTLEQAWVSAATAIGLGPRRVALVHTLRPALLPVVSRSLRGLAALLGGAVLVEQVFVYPGMGRLLWEAVSARDYVLMQGVFLVTALTVVAFNAMAEWLNTILDPRAAPPHRVRSHSPKVARA
jgi:peptide/nickel transport system permease protein